MRCAARATSCACRSGPALLGRVVDPLGRPLDGKGPIASEALRADRAPGAGDHRSRPRDRAGADRTSSWSMRCSRSAAASASSSSATAPSARRRSRSTRSSIRRPATSSASMSRSARRVRACGAPSTRSSRSGAPERCIFVVAGIGQLAWPAMDRALRRLHDGGVFSRPRPACPGRRRRSDASMPPPTAKSRC